MKFIIISCTATNTIKSGSLLLIDFNKALGYQTNEEKKITWAK